jgi:hypothetical protein
MTEAQKAIRDAYNETMIDADQLDLALDALSQIRVILGKFVTTEGASNA